MNKLTIIAIAILSAPLVIYFFYRLFGNLYMVLKYIRCIEYKDHSIFDEEYESYMIWHEYLENLVCDIFIMVAGIGCIVAVFISKMY